jgi:hypothetical protein
MLSDLHDIFPSCKHSFWKYVWMDSKQAVWPESWLATRLAFMPERKPDSKNDCKIDGMKENGLERMKASFLACCLARWPDSQTAR